MRKIILYTAVTIDGLIARSDGRVDWLDPYSPDPDGGDYGYTDFISGIDTTIMGYETFRVTKKLDGISAMSGFRNYVLTRKKDRPAEEHVAFLSDDIPSVIASLKEQQGGDIWLLGGGQINTLLVRKKLVDRMILTVIPIVLGEGIPLFAQPGPEAGFTLATSKTFTNGLVQSTYEKGPS